MKFLGVIGITVFVLMAAGTTSAQPTGDFFSLFDECLTKDKPGEGSTIILRNNCSETIAVTYGTLNLQGGDNKDNITVILSPGQMTDTGQEWNIRFAACRVGYTPVYPGSIAWKPRDYGLGDKYQCVESNQSTFADKTKQLTFSQPKATVPRECWDGSLPNNGVCPTMTFPDPSGHAVPLQPNMLNDSSYSLSQPKATTPGQCWDGSYPNANDVCPTITFPDPGGNAAPSPPGKLGNGSASASDNAQSKQAAAAPSPVPPQIFMSMTSLSQLYQNAGTGSQSAANQGSADSTSKSGDIVAAGRDAARTVVGEVIGQVKRGDDVNLKEAVRESINAKLDEMKEDMLVMVDETVQQLLTKLPDSLSFDAKTFYDTFVNRNTSMITPFQALKHQDAYFYEMVGRPIDHYLGDRGE